MDIPSCLPPSLLRERLEAVADIYRRADDSVAAFSGASGLSCPSGCGTCCEGFVPDILPAEAAYLATFLAARDRDAAFAMAASGLEARERDDGRVGCPLYLDDTPYHCSVYEGRPLVCRMFAFSGVRDKHGKPSYSPCRLMPGNGGAAQPEAPVMGDRGAELVALDPENAGDRRPLPEALGLQLSRVLFLLGLPRDPENDGPNMNPPVTQAS